MDDSNEPVVFDELNAEHGKQKGVAIDMNIPSVNILEQKSGIDSSDDDQLTVKYSKKSKKRLKGLSDSDSDKESAHSNGQEASNINLQDDSDIEPSLPQRELARSRLRLADSSASDDEEPKPAKNVEQQERMKNKRDKMKQKFNKLLSSRGKQTQSNTENKSSDDVSDKSGTSDTEMSSIATIKQKIKKSMTSMSSLCDPDTSDEEGTVKQVKQRGKKPRSAKVIEAKPLRMSAKQAMENMQMIKSESNRMLREKEVSLPYHRPKALSLKDIMSRRRTALASDGKALPIKMNEEQLKQYSLLLEERQKEMIELCKSDSENEESPDECENNDKTETIDNIEQNDDKLDADNEIADTNSVQGPGNDTENIENFITNINVENNTDSNNEEPKNNTEVEIDKANVEANIDETELNKNNNSVDDLEEKEQNNSNTDMHLVYNSSIEDDNIKETEIVPDKTVDEVVNTVDNELENSEITKASETDSQLMMLHYTDKDTENSETPDEVVQPNSPKDNPNEPTIEDKPDFFSDDDDDVNMEDIDRIIENAEIISEYNTDVNSPLLIKDLPYNAKPKLMGAPGMVIDLDGTDPIAKKLSGVELLKERFTYFARLKTPEELEKSKEKRLKPGTLHLKLKQDLENQIAEQRSLEWAKRLEDEKQQQQEIDTILDDEDIEKDESIEKEKTGTDQEDKELSSEEEEEELIEDDVEMTDKPKKRNPMVDDEAEESEDEVEDNDNVENVEGDENDDGEEDSGESSEEESSDEEEVTTNKKGRILKAFEDSDDEESPNKDTLNNDVVEATAKISDSQPTSQDDEIQLAQRLKSASDDLFTSQETTATTKEDNVSDDISTQTFSILEPKVTDSLLDSQEDMSSMQPYHDPKLDAVVDNLPQSILNSQAPASQSQAIGDDVLALCTGKFFDNQFVSPSEVNQVEITQNTQDSFNDPDFQSQLTDEVTTQITLVDNLQLPIPIDIDKDIVPEVQCKIDSTDNNLKSILDELDDPKFDQPKQNKFFTGGQNGDNTKKRFVIDSDDEGIDESVSKKKKLKKKKAEKRALQISDDEEDEEQEIENDDMSDIEDDTEKLVEYDSEENEIVVQPAIPKKKKRRAPEFFEQEAELTSEDEWVGSGDEDERGLDTMEREEGDDDVFHQGRLRNELGQIHMRDVLDQDKREVRLLQELLFEDGDLGGGHRQRKFRWKNADGGEEGDVPTDLTDTQEEEFESEEQWRKQRHEREVFLRQMQNEENKEDSLNVSINRTSIIKANLSSKSMSMLLEEAKPKTDTESPVVEKKATKDVPSPKKSFAIFQQSYHGSLLTRGRGALARLAALATPLAADDDMHKIGSLAPHKRNFVFATLTQEEPKEAKTTKRKADVCVGTPKLMKKMKIEDKKKHSKSSLLDHLNT